MKKFLSICYIIFMIALGVKSFKSDLKEGFPFWMFIFDIVAVIPGLISMFLWTFEFEPKGKWLWKIVPFMLVAYFAADWYFGLVVYRRPDYTNQDIVGATLSGLLAFFPLIYSSFKFGFADRE